MIKTGKYIGFCVHRRSYQVFNMAPRNSALLSYIACIGCSPVVRGQKHSEMIILRFKLVCGDGVRSKGFFDNTRLDTFPSTGEKKKKTVVPLLYPPQLVYIFPNSSETTVYTPHRSDTVKKNSDYSICVVIRLVLLRSLRPFISVCSHECSQHF